MRSNRPVFDRAGRVFGLIAAMGIAVPLALTTGCERKGPAQRAGENVDNAARDTGKAVERAGENLKDSAK